MRITFEKSRRYFIVVLPKPKDKLKFFNFNDARLPDLNLDDWDLDDYQSASNFDDICSLTFSQANKDIPLDPNAQEVAYAGADPFYFCEGYQYLVFWSLKPNEDIIKHRNDSWIFKFNHITEFGVLLEFEKKISR